MARIYNIYDIGDMIRLDAELTVSGAVIDPTYLSLSVIDPLDVEYTFIYGQTGAFVHPSTGLFYLDFYAQYPGQYTYRFYSSGTVWGAEVKRFVVKRQ